MIEVKNLTKVYGDHTAVDDLSFKIYNGKIYGLLGPNGAGKSTTMNMMTGCLAPTSGSVRINGFDVVKQPMKAKKCIGYLPEIPPVYGELTPFEYLVFVAEAKGVSYERAVRQAQSAMEMTDITDMSDRLIKNLSKGYRQRVGIAMTLLGDPDIIILDEPTVGLDPKQIIEVRALIQALGETKTVIVSSHILAEIREICDHVLIISGGKLIANAPIEELSESVSADVKLKLSVRGDETGVLEVLNQIEEIESCTLQPSHEAGVVSLALCVKGEVDLRDKIFFAMADRRYAVISMEKEEESLESIFLRLTEEAALASGEKKSARAKRSRKGSPEDNDRDGEYELIEEEKEEGEN
ncbi:MAG: ABC transporter ATP-binding protein [Ruminococcaceae bacterium]|nr:ABC transporter ATP-binding protein [Oscillospiraceae bacterium]